MVAPSTTALTPPGPALAASSTEPGRGDVPSPGRAGRAGVLLAVVGVVALRLPFVTSALGKDEAGYLYVGGRWALLSPGRSLYGDFWVDRPPLLLTLFGLADRLGGAVPLRLLGVLASAVAVLAVADAVDHLTRDPSGTPPPGSDLPARLGTRLGTGLGTRLGTRLHGWSPGWPAVAAALVTAGLLVTPETSSIQVNGEVLAAPFLALACAGTARALRDPAGPARPALLAGASAVAAVLIKQNLVDALLWGGLLTLASIPAVGLRRAVRVLVLATGGGLATVGVVAGWTALHGTSLVGVWEAMYPFRVASRDYLLAHPSAQTGLRQHLLVRGAAWSGALLLAALLGVLVVVVALDLARGRRRSPWPACAAVPATAVTLVWDAVSIDLGGFFWLHYLVQTVVPFGLAAGLVAHRWRAVGTTAALAVAASAAVAVVVLGPAQQPPGGNPVGRAVGEVAHRGDTIVTVFGNSDVTRASGLASPYPYLWSLPTAVLDPRLHLMVSTLDGPRAPTWFVDLGTTRPHFTAGAPRLRAALRAHYRRVADLGGSGVWLHDGVRRNAPVVAG